MTLNATTLTKISFTQSAFKMSCAINVIHGSEV